MSRMTVERAQERSSAAECPQERSAAERPQGRSGAAEIIAAAWRSAMKIPDVLDDDDFFELGGNSIVVTRIVSYLRRELGVEVDMFQLWDTSRFGDFREAVEAMLAGADTKGE
jgi:acyl carrier protein